MEKENPFNFPIINITMKNLLIVIASALLLSCNTPNNKNINDTNNTFDANNNFNIRKIVDDGHIGHGLYEIKIDDSTTIFLYRATESCAIIKK
jgi:hypothetical protein